VAKHVNHGTVHPKKVFHLNIIIDHGSTSPYPSLFEGKMHSKELIIRVPTAQDYGCNTNTIGIEYHPNSALLKFFNTNLWCTPTYSVFMISRRAGRSSV